LENNFSRKIILFLFLFVLTGVSSPHRIYSWGDDTASFEIAKKDFIRGLAFYNNMQYLAAVEFFRKAVSRYPDYQTAREYLARSYKLAGFSQAAMKEWSALYESNPQNAAVLAKIETLKYRESARRSSGLSGDLVFVKAYESRNYPRFVFSRPIDIAVDKAKNLYLTSFETGKLVILDSNGEGDRVLKPSLSGRLYGIDVYRDRIAVSDFSGDQVLIMDREGRVLLKIGGPGSKEGSFHGPEGLAFDRDGNLYVADSGNCRVQKFNAGGGFILSMGRKGRYDGELENPSDVSLFGDDVFIVDSGNNRLARFDTSGNFIEYLLKGELDSPRGITGAQDGVIIADEKKGYLYYTPSSGTKTWLSSWGDDNKKFARPVASAMDREGYLYCLDHDRDSVYLFAPAKKLYTNLDVDITAVDTEQFPVIAFYLNVRDRRGDPVYGLKPSNFNIIEDSALISNHSVNYIKSQQQSASMVLCIDRSRENSGYHNDIPWVSEFIIKKMRRNDRLKVLNFNRDTWTGNDFDWSARRARKAISAREYRSGKNFGAALYNSLGDLAGKLNRRGIIVVSDGSVDDTSFSTYTVNNIIQYAREHFIPIHVISFREPDPVLVKISSETGGSYCKASSVDSLRKIYDRIRGADENRYVLLYSTHKKSSLKGYWSDVKIEINHNSQKGVEWGGYFVP